MATLGEIAGGGQYGLNAPAMSEGTGVRFVRITDITQAGELRHEEPAFVPVDTPELDNYELKDGDVLIARSGATAGKSYVHHSFGARTVFAGYLIRFQPDTSKVLPRFVGAFLQTPAYWQQLNSHKRAVAQPNVNAKQLASLVLPMPPLAEQERIVKLLDEADELRKLRAQADSRTADLIPALFHEMFGDPAEMVKVWPCIQLAELCHTPDDIKCGPFGTQLSKSEYMEEGVPLWGIKNVNTLFELPTHEFLTPSTAQRLIQYSIEPYDIVMTRKGTVGNCAVYPEGFPFGIMHSDLLRLRVSREKCEPVFLAHQLHYSGYVARQLTQISGGAVMPGINVTKLKSLRVLAPPLAQQKLFAARVSEIRAMQAEQAASRRRLDDLFHSMLHRAFQGEL